MAKNFKRGKRNGSSNIASNKAGTTSSSGVSNSWLDKYPELVKAAGNLSFSQSLGTSLNLFKGVTNTAGKSWRNSSIFGDTIPGIMKLEFLPSYGYSNDPASPLNVASRAIYSYVRHANSGHTNYEAPDLMIYLMATDSLYMMYTWMARLYGTLNLYASFNRYLGDALIMSMGVDPTDIKDHIPDLRWFINSYAYKLQTLYVPGSMPIYDRHSWMVGGYYSDSEDWKSQTYYFNPSGLYQYTPVRLTTGGSLQFKQLGPIDYTTGTLLTFNAIAAYATSLIEPVITDSDMNIMSGDILKAYGDTGIRKIGMIGEDYIIKPSKDDSVLRQIENSNALGAIGMANEGIYQTDGYLVATYRGTGNSPLGELNKVLNSRNNIPTAEEVVDATRLMVMGTATAVADTSSMFSNILTLVGTEIIQYFRVYYTDINGTIADKTFLKERTFTSALVTGVATLEDVAMFSNFDWHPCLYMLDVETLSDGTKRATRVFDGLFREVNNYTVITYQDLEKIHTTAMLAYFDIPRYASV